MPLFTWCELFCSEGYPQKPLCKSLTANRKLLDIWFLSQHWTKQITPCERAWKTAPEVTYVFVWGHFCLWKDMYYWCSSVKRGALGGTQESRKRRKSRLLFFHVLATEWRKPHWAMPRTRAYFNRWKVFSTILLRIESVRGHISVLNPNIPGIMKCAVEPGYCNIMLLTLCWLCFLFHDKLGKSQNLSSK